MPTPDERRRRGPTPRQRHERYQRLAAAGLSGEQIAEVWRSDYPDANPRKALRWARDLSADDVASEWNDRNVGQPTMTSNRILDYEAWPHGGRRPTVEALAMLAAIYRTSGRLLLTDEEYSTYPESQRAVIDDIDERCMEMPDAMTTLADRARELMEKRGLSLRKLAKIAHYSPGYMSQVINGLKSGSPQLFERLDEILGANGEIVALASERAGETERADKYAALIPGNELFYDAKASGKIDSSLSSNEWDEMERRLFLQLAASLGLGSALAINSGGVAGHHLLDLAVQGIEPRDIEEWELACNDHLYALRTRPPAVARQGLMFDLLALHRQLRIMGRGSKELQRVSAALSTLHANLLTRLGDHGAAIRWWRAARHAADVSGDLELRLGIRATEAGHGLFGQRSPDTVLSLTQSAQTIVGDGRPSLGHTFLLCSQAKALSALGRHEEARKALNAYRDLSTGTLSTTDIMPGYWNGDAEIQLKLHNAEMLVNASMGNETATDSAKEDVLTLANGDYQIIPAIKLYEALCIVTNGGISRGMRQASTIMDELPRSQRTAMTLEHGRRVLRAVPLDARHHYRVREYREILATASAQPETAS